MAFVLWSYHHRVASRFRYDETDEEKGNQAKCSVFKTQNRCPVSRILFKVARIVIRSIDVSQGKDEMKAVRHPNVDDPVHRDEAT